MKKNWLTIAVYMAVLNLLINEKDSEGHAEHEFYTKTEEIQNLTPHIITGTTGNYYNLIYSS